MADLTKKISVLYEDSDVLVINKPAGLIVHRDGKTKEASIADWVSKKYPKLKKVGEPLKLSDGSVIQRPGIVHRLDRETSGALLVAKNQEAFLNLKNQFQKRKVSKVYNAFVYGTMREKRGLIELPIARSRKDFRMWSAERGSRGETRPAETFFKVLKENDHFTFLELHPHTGRTHQIRVHMKALQHPVVCDGLYASTRPQALGFKRLALHALSLDFYSPNKGRVKVEAPLPLDFKKALVLLSK